MNKKILSMLVMVSGLTSLLFAGDYQGMDNANVLMSNTEQTLANAITFGSFILGWALYLGFPVGGYYLGYKHFKEKDEQDRSGQSHTTMVHVKSAVVSIVALIAGSMIFTFLFVHTLHIADNTKDAINQVMLKGAFGKGSVDTFNTGGGSTGG